MNIHLCAIIASELVEQDGDENQKNSTLILHLIGQPER